MKLTLHRFELPCRHPFRIWHGTTEVQTSLVVELEQDGMHGYGEAVESRYYDSRADVLIGLLEGARSQIEAATLGDPTEFWEAMRPALGSSAFAQCALDVAAHDLWGKLRGAPVWKLWGLRLDVCPPSDYTIGIDTIEVMAAKLAEFPGWPIYKIKLGTDDDVRIVRELRRRTDAVFRVDANCGWDAERAIGCAEALKELGVEFIEQPLPAADVDGMRRVFRESILPVIADESCQREEDVDRCAESFHGVNVKLVKCGGLTPARRMVGRARQLGLKVMVGCFTESSVGISAAAQLLPLLDYADLDGALLLAKDIAAGVVLDHGRVRFPEENGCGVRLLP
jgi:L-alanine-DL-glutamate epimerase-like enolase superfamily enzyme